MNELIDQLSKLSTYLMLISPWYQGVAIGLIVASVTGMIWAAVRIGMLRHKGRFVPPHLFMSPVLVFVACIGGLLLLKSASADRYLTPEARKCVTQTVDGRPDMDDIRGCMTSPSDNPAVVKAFNDDGVWEAAGSLFPVVEDAVIRTIG